MEKEVDRSSSASWFASTWSAAETLWELSEAMRISSFSYSLSIGVAVAMLAGCGGSQPPIGAPAAAQAATATTGAYTARGSLIFEADEDEDAVNIYRTRQALQNAAPIAQIPTGGGPYGMALDRLGTLYVAQYYAWTVSEYPKGSTTAKTVISDGLHAPYGVAVDQHGTLFVSNDQGWISVYPYGSTTPSEKISGGGMQHPAGLAVDKTGNLFIADFNAQRVFEIPAGTEKVIQLQLADLSDPIGIAIDQQTGAMWVTDGSQINIYKPGLPYPTHEIKGFVNAYAISFQNSGRLEGYAALADSNANRIYVFKPGQYTPFTSFNSRMDQPTGVLIAQP
jgi:sugar lactone lactonase YvrE